MAWLSSVTADNTIVQSTKTFVERTIYIGSGSVYRESEFAETRDEALIVSAIKAEKLNQSDHAVVERFNKTLSLSDYEMHKIQSGVAHEAA
jgi:hypothetical protein